MKVAQSASLLFVFWMVLTGSVKPVDLAIGAALAVLLGFWSARSLWGSDAPVLSPRQALRFLAYIPFLIKEIVVAAVGVAEKVLDPRMSIDPVIITHRTGLERPVSRVAFANSITLTPGTITIDVDGPIVHVHCLEGSFAEGIANGDLEKSVTRVFEEP